MTVKWTTLLAATVLVALGCGGGEPAATLEPADEHDEHAERAVAAEPEGRAEAAEDSPTPAGEHRYGDPLEDGRELTTLGAILAAPETFADQVVRTEGEIAAVCQAMGCWMELREAEDGPAVRVPMAGHSFFLPKDISGRHATLEGRVALRDLSAEERAHLESEGASATAGALAIHATGVVVN